MAGTARGAAAIKLREVVSGLLARPEEPNPAFERRQGQGPYRGHHRRDPDQPDREPDILFGNLQKITSEQLGLSPVLMAAANSSGGVMGKMIDAQSIVVASTATNWYGHESTILRLRVQAFDRAGLSRRPAGHVAGLRLPLYGDGPEIGRRSARSTKIPAAAPRGFFTGAGFVPRSSLAPALAKPTDITRRGQAHAGTDRVDGIGQVSPPAKISFLMTAWTPQFPSTTWVMPKSTPTVIKEIASSSVSFLVVIRNLRILRNASRKARSTDDFE